MNTILFVYHTLYRLMKTQKARKIRVKKNRRSDRRLDGNKSYLLLELFTGIRAEAYSFFHSEFLGPFRWADRVGVKEVSPEISSLPLKKAGNYFITR